MQSVFREQEIVVDASASLVVLYVTSEYCTATVRLLYGYCITQWASRVDLTTSLREGIVIKPEAAAPEAAAPTYARDTHRASRARARSNSQYYVVQYTRVQQCTVQVLYFLTRILKNVSMHFKHF